MASKINKEAEKANDEMPIIASFYKPEPNYERQVDIEHGWGTKATMNHCADCKEIVAPIRNLVIKMQEAEEEVGTGAEETSDDDTSSKYPAPKILENGNHSIFCKFFDCEDDRAKEKARKQRKDFIERVIDWTAMICITILAVIIYLAAVHAVFAIYDPKPTPKCPNCEECDECTRVNYMNDNYYFGENFSEYKTPLILHIPDLHVEETDHLIPLTNKTKACCCGSKTYQEGCWCYTDQKDEVKEVYDNIRALERRDEWKFHPCEPGCLYCENLVDACLLWNGEDACWLIEERCNRYKLNGTHYRMENNLCEPGCLNCEGLHKQCMNKNDFPVCQTYMKYCSVNSFNRRELKALYKEATHEVCHGNKVYVDILKTAQLKKLTPEQCIKLKEECNAGYKMNNMIACVKWIFECDRSTKELMKKGDAQQSCSATP